MVANRSPAVLPQITLLVALRPRWIGASQQRPRHGSTGLLPPPALSERCHRSLARRRIAVRRPAVAVIAEGERPEPRRSYRRSNGFHDAADHDAIGEHVVIIGAPRAGGA